MQLDCHDYGTYYMARQAGFSREDARVIAWAAETVDELDFDRVRELKEKGVRIPYFVTVEALSESVDDQIKYLLNTRGKIGNTEIRTMMRGIWAPFHFLPGNFAGAVEPDAVWPYEGKTSIRMGVQSQSVLCDNTETDSDFFHVPVEGSTCGEDMKLLCRTSTETVRLTDQTDDRIRKLEVLQRRLREPQSDIAGFFPETEHLIRSRNLDPKLLAGDLMWFLAGRSSAAVLNQIYSAVTAAE